MPAAHETGARLRFGAFEFDPEGGERYRDGHAVRLQEQPRQVLAALLARPGDIETLARRGYRFIAPITATEPAPGNHPEALSGPATLHRAATFPAGRAALAALLIAALQVLRGLPAFPGA